jgi:methionyl-tRNA synthetase
VTRSKRKIFVTNALPYANGPIHLGHLVGYIQADIWVRFQRMQGHDVTYVCADDAHGTPIMLAAEKAGVAPEKFIETFHSEHARDFAAFGVDFDNYHTTHSRENRELSEEFYRRLQASGHIEKRTIEQLYDPVKAMFLPDRYIKGECPKCGTKDQYGDSCEHCAATYAPTDLKNPYSVVSGAAPVLKPSEHYFFKLSDFNQYLGEWLGQGRLQASVANKLREWLGTEPGSGLRDWDISRDAPYFGFEIPGAPGKFFYVWLDAPIGYLASLKNLCDREGRNWLEFWETSAENQTEVWHFIGKDIVNFHGLMWPAMLKSACFRSPTGISVNGYLTVNGDKMSKSRGTFIRAETYLKHLNPDALRYYYAAHLTAAPSDIDLNLADFEARCNSDIVGKYVNIASRCAGFIEKQFDGRLASSLPPDLLEELKAYESALANGIADAYESRDFAGAIRRVMSAADTANEWIQRAAPWKLAKDPDKRTELHQYCTLFLNIFRLFTIYLKPVMPSLAAHAEAFLNISGLQWRDVTAPLLGHSIKPYTALATRVDPATVNSMIEASKEDLKAMSAEQPAASPAVTEPSHISIDDFTKVDMRIGKIVKAEHIEGADKLLRLTIDLGELGERNVFAGIKSAYTPEQLEGRLTVVVANLAPRKMKFGLSEGMVLAAGAGGSELFILSPDSGAQPGMRVK